MPGLIVFIRTVESSFRAMLTIRSLVGQIDTFVSGFKVRDDVGGAVTTEVPYSTTYL
jgi:hypothetical protein